MTDTLFVVHTMGRCGSQSAYHSLAEAGHNVVHCHRLVGDSRPQDIEAREIIESWAGDIVVITMTRDPVARNLSAYYMNYSGGHPSLDDFLLRYPHNVPLTWFDEQVLGYWGVDVYNVGAEHSQKLLVVRCEDIEYGTWPQYMDVLGLPLLPIPTEGKTTDERYKQFIDEVRLPFWYLRRAYNSRYAMRFYTPAEIEGFMERWNRR